MGLCLPAYSLKRSRKDFSGGARGVQTVDHNHDVPGAGSVQPQRGIARLPLMDGSLHGQGQRPAVDGVDVRLRVRTSGATSYCHHQLWENTRGEGYNAQ